MLKRGVRMRARVNRKRWRKLELAGRPKIMHSRDPHFNPDRNWLISLEN